MNLGGGLHGTHEDEEGTNCYHRDGDGDELDRDLLGKLPRSPWLEHQEGVIEPVVKLVCPPAETSEESFRSLLAAVGAHRLTD